MSTKTSSRFRALSAATAGHVAHQGFCPLCGSVWPCWRAIRSGEGHRAAIQPTVHLSRLLP